MNKTLTVALAAAAILSGASLTSCGNTTTETGTAKASTSDGIDSIELKTTLLTASRAYSFAQGGQPGYATISVTAEWPREIGSTSLKALTDTLSAAAFGRSGEDVESAITGYLTDTSEFTPGPTEAIAVATIPQDQIILSETAHISRTALTSKYVTYTVESYSYSGGAHGMTAVTPITYDLTTGSVVTPSTLFKAGSDSTIIDAITNNLAMMLGTDPSKLTEGGLLTDTLPMPSAMSLDNDGQIVFQYAAYEIAPYSMGIIKVPVSPYQLRDVLTAQGQSLLN